MEKLFVLLKFLKILLHFNKKAFLSLTIIFLVPSFFSIFSLVCNSHKQKPFRSLFTSQPSQAQIANVTKPLLSDSIFLFFLSLCVNVYCSLAAKNRILFGINLLFPKIKTINIHFDVFSLFSWVFTFEDCCGGWNIDVFTLFWEV